MSFKETDFPGLITYLKNLLKNEKDPVLFKELVEQLVEMYDQLPIYPGIVNMCIGQAAKAADAKALEVGQQVSLKVDEDSISGVVKSKTPKGLVLKNATIATLDDEFEVEFREITKATVINKNIVKELWPSLVFDKEKK
ncbi:MAG: hypothetical protein M0R31_09415 [Candidatus Riflebacteria bacterium]|jgi:hypothetical protein|nr:hypothetical protein [Candidatus Riflebacteria bacterium]MDD2624659.1 hypothetical protein [Candidatus Riflebacteria bacterium]NCB45689.1 hypothetical protein [bacterium]